MNSNSASFMLEVESGGADDYVALSATIAAGGSGYSVNNVLTVSGGTQTTVATFNVTSVSGGVVTGVSLISAGHYTALPANAVATTVAPSGGTGCTLNVTWSGGGNGGGFDPGSSGFATDGAATSANTGSPVFSSASYTFLAGDVGAWLFIKSGTNWTPGFYQIASVAGGNATLSAAIGAAPICSAWSAAILGTYVPTQLNTAAGCATVASPTAATWGIDYSQQASPQFTSSTISISGTTAKIADGSNTIGKNWVGNVVNILSGTNFNVNRYVVDSVSGSLATLAGGSVGTLGASGGVMRMGGALGSVGQASYETNSVGTSAPVWVKEGTYPIRKSTIRVPDGRMVAGVYGVHGYAAGKRYFGSYGGNAAILQHVAGSVVTTHSGLYVNLTFDGNSQTSAQLNDASNLCAFVGCTVKNYNTATGSGNQFFACYATTNSAAVFTGIVNKWCEATANTATPFWDAGSGVMAYFDTCLSYDNTGASTDGFRLKYGGAHLISVRNGRYGFYSPDNAVNVVFNAHAEANVSSGYYGTRGSFLVGPSYYNDGATEVTNGFTAVIKELAPSGSVFTNAAGDDFSLNNLAGQGALLRKAAYLGFVKNLFPGGLTATYTDVGAAQHQDAASGGMLIHAGMVGGLRG